MPLRTVRFRQFPWMGGINTSLDASTIFPNQLVKADHLIFGIRGSRKKREGINYDWEDASANGSDSIVGLHDFWFGSTSRTQRLVGVTSGKVIYSYTSAGARSADLFAGTAWASAVTTSSFETLNNLCIIAVDGSGNVMKKWSGSGNVKDLGVNTATGDTTNGNPAVLNMSSLVGVVPGAAVSGTGIAGGTTVLSVSGTTLTLSANATATNAGVTLTFTVTCPAASIVREHLGRLWTNDKTNLDRIHYSTTGNPEEWLGLGDSGAIDINVGDGDPEGITGMFSFKGNLFVGKKTKLYRVTGFTPETMQVELISRGVGIASHNSITPQDQDDVFFISDKGVHSIVSTAEFGDFSGAFVSADIQGSFNSDWTRSRLKYSWGGYLNSINSIAFAVTDASTGSTSVNQALWLYNIPLKSWYRWPGLSCQALIVASDTDKRRFYLGTNTTRVGKTFNGTNYDLNTAGTHTAIPMLIRTGFIHVDDDPETIKGFKVFRLLYRPTGTHTVTVGARIDNFNTQSFSFSASGSTALLGSTFTLGVSSLGFDRVMAPYAHGIDGKGRSIQVTIEQSGIDEELEIQGFSLEYELEETTREVGEA